MVLSLLLTALLFLVIGGLFGFYMVRKFFPKYDYALEGLKSIVARIEAQESPKSYQPAKVLGIAETLKAKYITKGNMVAEVSVLAEERPNKNSKFLKRGTVSINVPGYGSWEIWSDEGRFGAGDQAPCPLDYVTIGTAFCMLSHLRLASEAMGMDPGNMAVEMRAYYGQYGGFGKAGTFGTTEQIKTHILIDSDLPQTELLTLIERGQKNCYASAGFLNKTPMETEIFINGANVRSNA
jgi:uncharacterized OsmC-like protein